MFKAYVPKITLSGRETRKGDGIGMRCNGQTMLFDGFEGGEPTNNLMSWLASEGVEAIDTVVLSHIHYDHYNGLLQIGQKYKIKLLYMTDPLTLKHGCDGSANGRAVKEDMDNAYKFIRKMQSYGTRVLWLDKGATIPFGDITWRVYRNQPTHFTDLDDGHAYAFVNDGSLVLWSPETELLLGGDGPSDIKDAIAYFKAEVSGYDISHHGNSCSMSNAEALKAAGCVVAWETNIERDGAGTTDFTRYGARRVVQAGIPVWMQDAPINIQAANGKIMFSQGDKTISKSVPYKGDGMVDGWGKDDKGWFYIQNGKRLTGWHKIKWSKGNDWFLFSPDGTMLTGWQQAEWSGGKSWFYLNPNTGAMQTGWVYTDGSWYYLDPETGAMKTGWLKWKNKWCYLEPREKHNQGHCYVSTTATIDGKTYRFDQDGYAEEVGGVDRSKKFIDISEHQGDVNWSKASYSVGCVYIRCGLRGSLEKTAPQDYKKIRYDKKWSRNLAEIMKYGVPFGAYYFPTAITTEEAVEGAKWFYDVVKDLPMSVPPILDSENVWGNNKEAGRANGLSKSERTRLLKIVTDYFNERGMNIGIYASASWLTSKIDMSAFPQCVRDCTWVADSTGAVDYKGYYWLHQYGKGACAGFSGDVDLNKITGNIPPVKIGGTSVQETPVDVAIAIAESYVGTHEGANNKTIFGDTMHAIQPRNMDKNAPWCDAFVDFVILKTCEHFGKGAQTARNVLCGDFDDYTYNSANLYKKAGRWSNSPHRGDQIFFGGSGHTGIVESVESGTIHTIEGNKGDEVRRCSYITSTPSIIGYGRPRYDLITGKLTAADMPLLKRGAQGVDVETLQRMLIDKGYSCGESGVDGSYGPATEAAVKKYQQDHGLKPVDGECGPITWSSLFG